MNINKTDHPATPTALTENYSHDAEHRILTRLSGVWALEGEWHLNPAQPTPVSGTMDNHGILGGHFIESRTLFNGVEKSRVIYGYDPQESSFMAFAISAIAARCDLEHGQYDDATDALCFSCVEYVGPKRLAVRFERTIIFSSANSLTMRITYPDFEPDRRLGMELRMLRA